MYWKEKIIGISKIKGDSNEIKCILAFIQLGWKVSIPYGEDSRYDLIVDRGNDLIRVQCKSCTLKDNKLTMWCMSNNKKYQESDLDYFATTYKNKCYLIPFKSQKCMSFRLVPPKSNQKKFIRFAQDYFIGNII